MQARDVVLPRLIQSLDSNAREIDITFATAGRELGQGLELFEALKQRLSSLSDELSGQELADAGAALAGLARQLRLLDGGLSRETSALEELSMHSQDASKALERLLEHMRLITILARSARIEAVCVHSSEHDFGNFTNEISVLTTHAQKTIQISVRDHQQLNVLLGAASAAQRDFQGRYGKVLSALADKLDATLSEVAARQRQSVVLTSNAAIHSGKIAMAAGGAIIALQSGDSIRQRLEHAIAALRIAVTLLESGCADAHAIDPAMNEAASHLAYMVLCRLQAAQLDASAVDLAGDADAIEAALALLAVDTASLLDLVAGLYRGEGGASASFLNKLEAELEEASDLLGKCDTARAGVDRVTAMLSDVLQTCHETVSGLAETVSSIELIGLNAGLRAARLGDGGRSLVVIAQELKTAADQVARDAGRLGPNFAGMQKAAAGLRNEDSFPEGHFAQLDTTMKTSLEALRGSGERLAAALDRLVRDGHGFGAVITQARLSFSNAGAMSDVIASAAEQLDVSARPDIAPDPQLASGVTRFLQDRVWPSYTMAAERTIHLAVVARCGLQAEVDDAPAHRSAASEAVDDILF